MKESEFEKLYKDVKKYEVEFPEYIIVPKKVKEVFDKAWNKLPLWQKMLININRVIHGRGLYKVGSNP